MPTLTPRQTTTVVRQLTRLHRKLARTALLGLDKQARALRAAAFSTKPTKEEARAIRLIEQASSKLLSVAGDLEEAAQNLHGD